MKNKYYYISVDPSGKILSQVAAYELLDISSLEFTYAISEPLDLLNPTELYVFDIPTGDILKYFKEEGKVFNYSVRAWEDIRTPEEVRNSRWALIKTQRDVFEFGGFTYDGNVYDSDQVSQARIVGASTVGLPQTWTLADNSTVELTAQEVAAMYVELQRHIALAHERGRQARAAIDSAETAEDIESVEF